jgi:hypothetical protein
MIILKWILKYEERAWNGLIWLRLGPAAGLVNVVMSLGSSTRQGILWSAKLLSVSKGFCFIYLVN